jgi:hypothetical protein
MPFVLSTILLTMSNDNRAVGFGVHPYSYSLFLVGAAIFRNLSSDFFCRKPGFVTTVGWGLDLGESFLGFRASVGGNFGRQ